MLVLFGLFLLYHLVVSAVTSPLEGASAPRREECVVFAGTSCHAPAGDKEKQLG